MLSLSDLHLRPMTGDDLDTVMGWRNSPHVRRYGFNDDPVTADEHKRWFEMVTADPACDILIAEYRGQAIGLVAIKDISPCHGTCSWGFYIGEDMRDSGIGVLMEIHGIDHMVTTHNIRKIFGDALKSSERVLHLHKQFGFVEEAVFKEQVYKDGGYEDVVRIALFTEKWPHIRKRVMDQFVLVE